MESGIMVPGKAAGKRSVKGTITLILNMHTSKKNKRKSAELFESDSPIYSAEEDRFGRKQFAVHLAKAIFQYHGTDSLCIGITGPWGTGKTSIVNMTFSEIGKYDQSDKPILVRFNPWNYLSREQLISNFFQSISQQFKSPDTKQFESFIKNLGKYSSLLVNGSGNPVVRTIGQVLDIYANSQTDDISDNLEEIKLKISKQLLENHRKIIISIDDIDRLPDEQIRQVFQLVAVSADFPNTIYLLSFDKDVVVKALSKTQDYGGDRYLEKIVQVGIEIPKLNFEEKEYYFNLLLKDVLPSEISGDKSQYYNLERIYLNILPLIETPRDIKRLKNSLELKLSILGEDVNILDLLILTLIEQKYPELYQWIFNNKKILINTSDPFIVGLGVINKPEDRKKIIEENIKRIAPNHYSDLISLINILFPEAESGRENAFRNQEIADADFFDRYFSYKLGSESIPRRIINDLLFDLPAVKISDDISNLFAKGKGKSLNYELKGGIKELSPERAETLAKGILGVSEELVKPRQEKPFSSLESSFTGLVMDLLGNIEVMQAFHFLEDQIKNAEFPEIRIISEILDYQKNIISSKKKKPLFSETSLQRLFETYYYRFIQLDNRKNVFKLDQGYYIAYSLIEEVFPEKYREWLGQKFKDDLNILRYFAVWRVSSMINLDNQKRSFHLSENPNEFVDGIQFKDILDRCISDGRIEQIDREKLLSIAAYNELSQIGDQKTKAQITEEECNNIVDKWLNKN